MYHNTTNETGERLGKYRVKAKNQSDLILEFFKKLSPISQWTPSEIQKSVLPTAPLTSVRRAMTDMTKEGLLIKTDQKLRGIYGRPEHTWRLK